MASSLGSTLAGRLVSALAARLSRRFATKAARFRLAVTSGFVVTAASVGIVGLDRAGFADGLFDLFGGASIFGQPQPETTVQGEARWGARVRRRHVARRGGEIAKTHLARARASEAPTGVGRHSMCVRLCDGYAFPVGAYHGEADRAAHEATCHAQCPGAETALYVMPGGSDSMADAVRVGSGRNYSQLPDAFHYTSVLDGACTCHPQDGNRISSLLHDFTLRRGDAVMTRSGLKIFHGAPSFPFRRRDFVALSQSRDVAGTTRATFKAIERASLTGRTDTAQQAPARLPPADRMATRALEHQASR